MVEALCIELEPSTMVRLQRQRRPVTLREASSSRHLVDALERDPSQTEVVILGEEVEDPLRLVHHVHALDPDLAVLILARGATLAQLREAVFFLPSLGGDVLCVDATDGARIPPLLRGAALRTQRRRSVRAANNSGLPEPGGHTRPGPLLARILEHCPMGMLALDSHGRVQLGNAAALEALGVSERELVGRPMVLLFHEQEWKAASAFLARCSATERAQPKALFRRRLPSGAERRLELSATPLHGRRGEPGTLVFLTDVTA